MYGARYRAGKPVDDVVAFDDPAIRWTRAAQLVRELSGCSIERV